jgi:hypothetical protein
MRVRSTHPAITDVETIVHERDERISVGEILGRHDVRRKVPGTNESRGVWRNGDDTSDTTLLRHGDLLPERESGSTLGIAGLVLAFTGPGALSLDRLLGYSLSGEFWGASALLVGLAGGAIQLAQRRRSLG